MTLHTCARRSIFALRTIRSPRSPTGILICRTTIPAPSLAAPSLPHRFYSSTPTSKPTTTDEDVDDYVDHDSFVVPEIPDSRLSSTSTGTSTNTGTSSSNESDKAPFIPRGTFEKPGNITNSYYLGHHKRGLERIQQTLGSVDMVLECRDYRVPLSSRNPMFEEALQGKERVIVYTKRDLGQVVLTEQTRNIITNWHKPNKVIFADTGNKGHIKEIVTHLQDTARDLEKLTGMRVLIVGMPNVGKSSLLNTLARVGAGNTNKVARTGRQPGVTRKLSTTIKISDDPLIYVIDTPGIFVPYLPNPITMLKLALVGSIKDNLVPPMTLADFLLFHMNRNGVMSKYRIWSKPTDALVPFLTGVARQTGRLKKGGEPLLTDAATWIINRYRRGDLGRFMLDDVHKGGLQEAVEEEEGWGESDTAARRRIKKEIVAAKKKKHVKGGAQV